MTLAEAKTYSPEELDGLENAVDFELVGGQLVERAMGAESSAVGLRIGAMVLVFVIARRLGHVFGTECGYRCFSDDADKVRKPDASFVSRGRLPNDRPPTGYILIAPDLAVEVLSPGDLATEVEKKVHEYLEAGVKLIWVVDPGTRSVRIHRPARGKLGPVGQLFESDTISGEDIIPGFECPVRDFFDI